jgi:hypothetical protein
VASGGGAAAIAITNAGNVGIGNTNPRAKLDIITPVNTATATNLLDFSDINNYGIVEDITQIIMHTILQFLKVKYLKKTNIKDAVF